MVGTPAYMSPEQITGGNIDKRTDVFSAGIILYQFLTGEKPFTGSGAWTIAKKIIQEEPPLPSSLNNAVTPLFDAVVNKALAKNPDQRYQSARDLAVALKRALEGIPEEDDSDRTVVGAIAEHIASVPRPAPDPRSDSTRSGVTGGSTQAGNQEVELEFWRAIKDGNDPEDFNLYVQQFPTGIYAALAKRKIAKLRGVAAEETSAKAKEQEKKEAEEAALAAARLEGEKAKREAEEKARENAEKLKQEAAAAAQRARLEAEKAKKEAEEKVRQEAEKARRDAEEKARKQAELRAKKDAEERAKREAQFKKREAELKAQAAAGGKKSSPVVAIVVGGVVFAIAGVGYLFIPTEDPQAAAKLQAMQKQLDEAKQKAAELEVQKKKEQEARIALENARKAEEDARKAGDLKRHQELADARLKAEAEAQKQADTTKLREAEAKKTADAAEAAKQQTDPKKADAVKGAEQKAIAEKLAQEKAAVEQERQRLAADKAAAEKAAAEARAATEKAKEQIALAATTGRSGGAASGDGLFHQALALEGEGKGAEAVKVYTQAARSGNGKAAKRLGEIYDKGLIGI